MNKLKSFVDYVDENKKINGQVFDELFNIEDIPLRWFYRRFFAAHVVPKQINTFNLIKERKDLNRKDRIRFSNGVKILKRYIVFKRLSKKIY